MKNSFGERYQTAEAKSRLEDQLRDKRILNIITENSKVTEKQVPYKSLFQQNSEQE